MTCIPGFNYSILFVLIEKLVCIEPHNFVGQILSKIGVDWITIKLPLRNKPWPPLPLLPANVTHVTVEWSYYTPVQCVFACDSSRQSSSQIRSHKTHTKKVSVHHACTNVASTNLARRNLCYTPHTDTVFRPCVYGCAWWAHSSLRSYSHSEYNGMVSHPYVYACGLSGDISYQTPDYIRNTWMFYL